MLSDDELLTMDEVATRLHCSKLIVYRQVRRGLLPYRKFGKALVFFRSEIEACLQDPPSLKRQSTLERWQAMEPTGLPPREAARVLGCCQSTLALI